MGSEFRPARRDGAFRRVNAELQTPPVLHARDAWDPNHSPTAPAS